jgi:hypothetical protein
LTELKAAENELDLLALKKLEMEAVWAHLGTVIFDLSGLRAQEMTTAAGYENLSQQIRP